MPYLVDGNNLLGSWGGPARGDDRRMEVVRRVAAFCRGRGARATVVFDGQPFRPSLGQQDLGPVSLRFPEPGRDADSVIRDLVDRAPRPAELSVVTSDKALYSYARTRGASVLRAHEWNSLAAGRTAGPARRGAVETSEKPQRETDVDGWLKRFSRD
jgi:predicted RNA-binding protein with PIN domain